MIIFSTMLALVICELVLVILWPPSTGVDLRGITVRDAEFGYRFVPNSKKIIHGILNDFSTTVKINSSGFRSKEYPVKAGPKTFRIALFGDSEVFGVGVEEEDMLNIKIEEILNKNSKINYEVLNFALPATGTIVHGKIFEKIALKWKPSAAIFIVTVANDLSDNIGFTNNPPNPWSPKKIPATIQGRLRQLQLYQLAKYKILPNIPRFLAPRSDWIGSVPPFIAQWYTNSNLEGNFAVMTVELERIKNVCARNNIKMYLAAVPGRSQFDPAIIRILRKTTEQNLLQTIESDIDRPQRMLREFAGKKRISYISILDMFKKLANTQNAQLKHPNDGHLNSRGTFEIAVLLSDNIRIPQKTD